MNRIQLILLFSFFLPICLLAQTEPVLKSYAFKLPATESSNEEGTNKSQGYRMYLEHSRNQCISVSGVWIGTNYYKFKTRKNIKTPIENPSANAKNKILIPSTKNKLMEIVLIQKQSPSPRPGSELIKYLRENEALIVYKYKGEQYYAPIKKIEDLESVL
jgi:hypothetical protein